MADYGVSFDIVNDLGAPLRFHGFASANGRCTTYDGPETIPSDGRSHRARLTDGCFARGAAGEVAFVAAVGDQRRQYTWRGSDPVWWPLNRAGGPGVAGFNRRGHPLEVSVRVDPDTPGWTPADQHVEHVFLLMLENRSFDHFLGFSGIAGRDAVTGAPTTVDGLSGDESNLYDGVVYRVHQPAAWSMPLDPPHDFPDVVVQLAGQGAVYPPGGPYPPIDDAGFVAAYAGAGGKDDPGEVMGCFAAGQLPVLEALAREFAVCDGWYSSMPGPTWPNRFFAMAASAGGLDHGPTVEQVLEWLVLKFRFEHGTLFQALTGADLGWRVYRGDRGPLSGAFPVSLGVEGVSVWNVYDYSHFATDVGQPDYPCAFTLIEPNYGDVTDDSYKGGTSQHPRDDVRHGERLIKQTYEALRSSPLWEKSVLIVTWDEHGGFYDHTSPGAAVPPGDRVVTPGVVNKYGFTFGTLGVRLPAVVVSPRVPANTIDHRGYDHASIPATVERACGLPPLTQRDAAARDVLSLLSLSEPRPTPTTLPEVEEPPPPPPPTAAEQAEQDARPITDGNLVGFLHVALQAVRELVPDDRQAAHAERVASLRTRGEARRYLEEVGLLLAEARRR